MGFWGFGVLGFWGIILFTPPMKELFYVLLLALDFFICSCRLGRDRGTMYDELFFIIFSRAFICLELSFCLESIYSTLSFSFSRSLEGYFFITIVYAMLDP